MGDLLGKILSPLGIPGDIVPLALVRLFSSSAAASLLLDIFKEHGTESTIGFIAAIIPTTVARSAPGRVKRVFFTFVIPK